jgi:hypothetical protein
MVFPDVPGSFTLSLLKRISSFALRVYKICVAQNSLWNFFPKATTIRNRTTPTRKMIGIRRKPVEKGVRLKIQKAMLCHPNVSRLKIQEETLFHPGERRLKVQRFMFCHDLALRKKIQEEIGFQILLMRVKAEKATRIQDLPMRVNCHAMI